MVSWHLQTLFINVSLVKVLLFVKKLLTAWIDRLINNLEPSISDFAMYKFSLKNDMEVVIFIGILISWIKAEDKLYGYLYRPLRTVLQILCLRPQSTWT